MQNERLSVMNFLNEATSRYPDATSFASGRPVEFHFRTDRWGDAIREFQTYVANRNGQAFLDAGRDLAQYGKTNGVVNELIAQQLHVDEGIECCASQIVVTSGCQEAIALCISTLCSKPGDVILARNPTYIGVTGAADFAGIEIVPVDVHPTEDWKSVLAHTIERLRRLGKRPRALYLTPEFDNPTGTVLDMVERQSILEVCSQHRIAILEDNPYGMFRFDGERMPAMVTLDKHGCVIYLATYSKTLCPALRVGAAVVPTTLFDDAESATRLRDELSERKSFLTLNTSQVTQAIVGGTLLAERGSLLSLIQPSLDHYRINRDVLLSALAREFSSDFDRILWNRPQGGFFLSLSLPFEFGKREVVECAEHHGVLALPMSFLALDDSHKCELRLAFSNLAPEQVDQGIQRLGVFVRKRLS
jgi:(S)-3,5-dihydroxyphenylglycine transaminase